MIRRSGSRCLFRRRRCLRIARVVAVESLSEIAHPQAGVRDKRPPGMNKEAGTRTILKTRSSLYIAIHYTKLSKCSNERDAGQHATRHVQVQETDAASPDLFAFISSPMILKPSNVSCGSTTW